MEKAIEIKRRAQRCIQNGDLDGALIEYEKLVSTEDSDPYNFVLLADLLFKRGDPNKAVQRYLAAVGAYEKAGLYKNAIAVCKKMMRLTLAPALVLERLGSLHQLDGLATEAALYFSQYAEHLVREDRNKDATAALRRAFDACNDEVKVLERLAEVHVLAGEEGEAAGALAEAVHHYLRLGMKDKAERARARAEKIRPGSVAAFETASPNGGAPETLEVPMSRGRAPELGMIELDPGPMGDPAAGASLELAGPQALPLDPADSMANPIREGEIDEVAPPRLDAEILETESYAPALGQGFSEATPPGLEEPLELAEPDPPRPGMRFTAPAHEPLEQLPQAEEPTGPSLADIERLLASAQDRFRAGDRDGAGNLLVDAAQAYEEIGKLDNAASIYRSLSKSPQSSPALIELWLANCERREDRREAAEVACELGDRALQDGDTETARAWFERACFYDQNNAVARRRLDRLAQMGAAGQAVATSTPAPAAPRARAPQPEPEDEAGRVAYSVGRGEAVTFDLGSLLSEFQRGIEAQLSGDAQSHYDLAMTYREMGLLDQAVESFRMAGSDPAFAHRASEMIGRCLLDQGRFDEAAQEFAGALRSPGLEPSAGVNLRYQLGLALEAAGRLREALDEFEQVFAQQPSFPDVALKLRVLRKSAGNG